MSLKTEKETPGYGNFGVLSKNYRIGRKEYPSEVMQWVMNSYPGCNPTILDIGCGTGIATRQIRNLTHFHDKIIGCDKDGKMIKAALDDNESLDITYVLAEAESLPFLDDSIDTITAFQSFQWFANRTALSEIQRVLKLEGILCIVSKHDTGNFQPQNLRALIRTFVEYNSPQKLDSMIRW